MRLCDEDKCGSQEAYRLGQGRICPQKDAQALTAKRHGGGVGAEARRLAGVAAGVADFNSSTSFLWSAELLPSTQIHILCNDASIEIYE